MTALTEAAAHLTDSRDAQRHALDLAQAIVDKLPIEPFDVTVTRVARSFDWRWGVQINVHEATVEHFPRLAVELHAVEMTEAEAGAGRTRILRTLTGVFSGVPFEIRTFAPRLAVA